MTKFVILTDEPEKLRRAQPTPLDLRNAYCLHKKGRSVGIHFTSCISVSYIATEFTETFEKNSIFSMLSVAIEFRTRSNFYNVIFHDDQVSLRMTSEEQK